MPSHDLLHFIMHHVVPFSCNSPVESAISRLPIIPSYLFALMACEFHAQEMPYILYTSNLQTPRLWQKPRVNLINDVLINIAIKSGLGRLNKELIIQIRSGQTQTKTSS